MFFEIKSKYGFDETMSKLQEHITEADWRVIHMHDLKETMRKNGFEVMDIKVIELCMPKYAQRLLSKGDYRLYANMLPCRIAVYKKEDGKTYVSQINMSLLASQIGGEVENVMTKAYDDIQMIIENILE